MNHTPYAWYGAWLGRCVAIVNALLGREEDLGKTNRIIAGMRLFSLRFDTYCEEILREPTV